MNCWRIQTLLAPYLDGELPGMEQEAFEAHTGECSDCNQLVEDVAALPSLAPLGAAQEDTEKILDALSESISQRIAAAAPRIDSDGNDLPIPDREAVAGGFLAFLSSGELRVSGAAAAAYVGVVLLLAAGIALNHQRVVDLESSIVERDSIIDGMSLRLAAAQPEDLPLLTPASPDAAGVVIMPAGSTGVAGITGPPARMVRPAAWTGSHATPYTVSHGLPDEGPRIVH